MVASAPAPRDDSGVSLMPIIMLPLGGLFLLAGVVIVTRRVILLARSVRTTGKVIAQEQVDSGADVTWKPVVSFQLPDGAAVTFTTLHSSAPPEFAVGDTVPVLYSRRTPSHAAIGTIGQMWGLAVIFVIVGGFCVGLGLYAG